MTRKINIPEDTKELPLALVKQMLSLATSGFGLVAALAWNELVKEAINTYVKPYLPEGSKVISLLLKCDHRHHPCPHRHTSINKTTTVTGKESEKGCRKRSNELSLMELEIGRSGRAENALVDEDSINYRYLLKLVNLKLL